MPRSEYETVVKKRETCAVGKGLTGCNECKNNIWSDEPCDLAYELAIQDIKNMEHRLAEMRTHYDALQHLGAADKLQTGLEADLKKHYGYKITIIEFTENAETYVKLLKARVARRDGKSKL